MPTAGLTATALGSQQVRLTAADFSPALGGKTIPGVRSTLARYRVPHQGLLRLYADRPYGLYLSAFHSPAALTQPATPDTTYAITLPNLPAQSTRVQAAQQDVVVYVWDSTTADVSWTATTVSVDYSTGLVTANIPVAMQTAGDVLYWAAYYLGSVGGVNLGAQAPAGTDRVVREVWSESVRAVHETDQATGKTALTLAGGHRESPYGLPEGWELLLELATTDTYYWDAPPVTAIAGSPAAPVVPAPAQFLYYQGELVKLAIHDRAALNMMADRHLAS